MFGLGHKDSLTIPQAGTEEYIAAIIGGIFIGIACTLNYYLYGRIVGMSGLFNTLFKFN